MSSETNELCPLPNRGLLFYETICSPWEEIAVHNGMENTISTFRWICTIFITHVCNYVMGNAPKVHLESNCSSYYSN